MDSRRLLLLHAALAGTLAAHRADAQDADRVDVRVTGTILVNTFSTSRRTNNFDIPQFVVRPSAADSLGDGGGFGMTVRQTRLGVRAFWPDVRGAEVRAELDTDFYGGQQASGFGDLFALFRVRRAVVDAAWSRATLLIGQEVPLIAEYNPQSLAMVGLSGLATSGNLWLWLPQVRGGVRVARGKSAKLDLEAAIVGAGSNEAQGELFTQPDRAEQSGRPSLQGRAIVRWGTADRPGDISLGAHRGWLATSGDSLLVSRAIAAAWRLPLGKVVTLTGEAFTGAALTGLGGGGIGQHLGPRNVPVESRGGWSQLLVQVAPELSLGGMWGMDDPEDAQLDVNGRLKNATWGGSVQWMPAPFVSALEVRQITTTYRTGALRAVQVNLALGVSF
ncbi:MAG: hypothetical protein JNJ98_19900 [Gemmatimonadetes bacterium]|nr:hypothetical protein [Gemmatimonadota bacterium]